MPLYSYRCDQGCYFERFLTVAHYQEPQHCELHRTVGERIIGAPLLVAAQAECRYDSPITGEPITTWSARANDLAKHGCRPYDPEMKTDWLNGQKAKEAAIDRAIDEDVERAYARMPKAQKDQLHKEMVNMNLDVEYQRTK